VAQLFKELGAVVIDADQLGHEVLKRPLNARRIGQMFGTDVLAADGGVRRTELANLVFGEGADAQRRLKELEKLTHPQIHADAVKILRQLQESDTPPALVVLDAPLLLEAGWEPMCDVIVFIDSPASVRQQRAAQRGWTEQQFQQRENAQMPLEQKRKKATHIVNGDAPRTELTQTVERLCNELIENRK